MFRKQKVKDILSFYLSVGILLLLLGLIETFVVNHYKPAITITSVILLILSIIYLAYILFFPQIFLRFRKKVLKIYLHLLIRLGNLKQL
jgi:hypothetical protein